MFRCWSGCAGAGLAGLGPGLFPPVAGVQAAQGEDAVGAGEGPSHPGQFAALRDDGFASRFHGAGSYEHSELAEVGVTHPVSVVLEVAQGGLEVAGFLAGQGEGTGGSADRLDVAVIQLSQAGGQLVFLAAAEHEFQ